VTKLIYVVIASLFIGGTGLIIHGAYITGVNDGINQLHQCQYDVDYFAKQAYEARDELIKYKKEHP